ncbi:hypothetical protein ACVW07_003057 [Cellulomonas sp. URHB0016]
MALLQRLGQPVLAVVQPGVVHHEAHPSGGQLEDGHGRRLDRGQPTRLPGEDDEHPEHPPSARDRVDDGTPVGRRAPLVSRVLPHVPRQPRRRAPGRERGVEIELDGPFPLAVEQQLDRVTRVARRWALDLLLRAVGLVRRAPGGLAVVAVAVALALAAGRVTRVHALGRAQAAVVEVERRPADDGAPQQHRDLAEGVRVVDVHQQVRHLRDEPEAAPLATLDLDELRLRGVVRQLLGEVLQGDHPVRRRAVAVPDGRQVRTAGEGAAVGPFQGQGLRHGALGADRGRQRVPVGQTQATRTDEVPVPVLRAVQAVPGGALERGVDPDHRKLGVPGIEDRHRHGGRRQGELPYPVERLVGDRMRVGVDHYHLRSSSVPNGRTSNLRR